MASYFRKSIKIAPGIHLNLSKRGTGISLGGRGAHISLSPTGRVTKTVNIPGTGIYYRDVDTLHSKARSKQAHSDALVPENSPPAEATFNERQVTDGAGIVVIKKNGVLLPQPEEPAVHQVAAVDHHGFYISHGIAAFASILAAVIVNVHYGSHPLNLWVPILGVIGAISLILWLMDLTQTKVERRTHE